MGKIKRDLLDRLMNLPTTILGFIIILIGLLLVVLHDMTMEQFTAFMVVSMPFFFYRSKEKSEDKKEE